MNAITVSSIEDVLNNCPTKTSGKKTSKFLYHCCGRKILV